MKIHRRKLPLRTNTTMYYFTKNRHECLCIEHDLNDDFGEHDPSGSSLNVIIHYQNSWVKHELEKITMADVPKRVKDILTYLSNTPHPL